VRPSASGQIEPYSKHPSETRPFAICPPPTKTRASCLAVGTPNPDKLAALGLPRPSLEGSGESGGYSPTDLRSAYKLPKEGGEGMTVAIVDAYDDPKAESDLAKYRETYGLSECSHKSGCFTKVNQKGEEGSYPEPEPNWALETSLDLDMVSAACPKCHILLVEANNPEIGELGLADAQAAEPKFGADAVSNSWGTLGGFSFETEYNHYFKHPGIPVLFSSGDYGYAFYSGGFGHGTLYPSTSPDVIAVGGTSLKKAENSRGWSESAWSGSGSGCSEYEEKPGWQLDETCPKRTTTDVSAVAAPKTPVSVYDSYETSGWWDLGGTSASAPLVAGIEALSSEYARSLPGGDVFYAAPGELFDVTTGNNNWEGKACTAPAEGPSDRDYFCNAKPGYDAPTGNGTPNGPIEVTSLPPLALTRPPTSVSGSAAALHGTVDPQGFATTYRFEYGTTSSYGTSAPAPDASAGSGTTTSEVSKEISGLSSNTTYHYRLVATNSAGVSHGEDRMFRTAAPTVTGISPASGAAAGGTVVTVSGTNFAGVSAVKFGAVKAESFKVESETLISAVAPTATGGVGQVDVTVTTPGGTSATGTPDHFTYQLTGQGRAWGGGYYGALGNRHSQVALVPTEIAGLSRSVAFARAAYSSAALTKEGTVMTWGEDWIGELGNGGSETAFVPVKVCAAGVTECPNGPYLEEVTALASGVFHTLALLQNGTVVGWGQNYEGQLASGSRAECQVGGWICSRTPVPVCVTMESPCKPEHYLKGVTAIAAGSLHSLALLEDGTVMAWGMNKQGQLGNGSSTGPELCGGLYPCSQLPEPVKGLSEVTAITAGGNNSYALLKNGTVKAWGENGDGELGDGTTTDSSTPVAVCATAEEALCAHSLSGVTAIAADGGAGYALLEDGTVRDWGLNYQGQLGIGKTTETGCDCISSPVEVSGLSGVTALAPGTAVLKSGRLMTWGVGGLGDGQQSNASHLPVRVCATYASGPCPSGPYLDEEGKITTALGGVNLVNVSSSPEWELHPPPNVEGATESKLEWVSCSSSTACEATGFDKNGSGVTVTLAERWNGSEWSIQSTPNPGGAKSNDLEWVSCTSSTACEATGHYENSSGAIVTLAEGWNGSEWSLQSTPSPEGAKESRLYEVSCSSASACTAAGRSLDSSGHEAALVERWNGTKWEVQSTPNPEGAQNSDLVGASCTASTACEATGHYQNSAGTWVTLAERWNGTKWEVQSTPNPEGAKSAHLVGVSCTSSTACTAAGYYQNSSGTVVSLAERWNGTKWEVQSTPNPEGAKETTLYGMSCTSSTACTAAGYYQNGSGTTVTLAEAWNGTKWEVQSTPNPEGAKEALLAGGVSCTSSSACTAAGSYKNSSGTVVTLAERWNGTKWEVQATPNRDGTGQSYFDGEPSCATATACEAVGIYTNSSGEHPMAQGWNGLEWTIQWTPSPAGAKEASLTSASCSAAAACTAIGHYKNSSGVNVTLAERWNGSEWAVQSTPNPEGASDSRLTSVSCSSSTACMATGYYKNSSGTWVALSERWNGTTWSLQSMPNPTGAKETKPEGVSCVSSTSCKATGYYENSSGVHVSLAETWNGTSWEVQSSPNPEGAKDSRLFGVSCISSESCRAAGYYENASGSRVAFTESWGSKWEVQSIPNPEGAQEAKLYGMSCPSSTSCRATGWYRNGASENISFGVHWNGTAWSLEAVPSPSGSKGTYLGGVSCPTSAVCLGSGYYLNSSGVAVTLAESLGDMPPFVATRSATSVSEANATLNGAVNPSAGGTEYFFEYGTTTSYGSKSTVGYASGTSTLEKSKAITGLAAGQTYHFRLAASNAGGTAYGEDQVFTTTLTHKAPKATTEAATAVRATEATLNGGVNPEGSVTSYYFEYGPTTAYGTKIPTTAKEVGWGTSNVVVSQTPTGLEPLTVYHFRLVALNAEGTSYGEDRTFTTDEPAPAFSFAFGAKGSGNGQFSEPSSLAADAEGNLWVTDYLNDRVQKFNSKGEYLSQFGSFGTGNGQFNLPEAIAIDKESNLWVVDRSNYRVQKFNSKGEYLSQFGSFGTGNGQLNAPSGIAIDTEGNLWVTDYKNKRVQKFNSKGEYLSQFGTTGSGNGQFSLPQGSGAFDAAGNFWITDTGNNRVEEFNSKGEYLSQFGSLGSGNGQLSGPRGIVVSPSGNLWVNDKGNNRVEKFNSKGEYLGQFGTAGSGNGQLSAPKEIAIDKAGSLWVVDTGNNRVQKWVVPSAPAFSFAFGTKGSGNGQFSEPSSLAADAEGNLWVTDYSNNRVQKFNSKGEYLSQFGSIGSENGKLSLPEAIAIDKEGNLWVVERGNCRVQKFNSKGEYLSQFGTIGSGNGQLNVPSGIAIDAEGNLWVTDGKNHRIQKFNSKGEYLSQFGSSGSGNGQFGTVSGSGAFDAAGNFWIADTTNNRVEEFNSKGEYLSQFGTKGSGNGQLSGPRGIVVSPSGNLWVLDKENNHVEKFNSKGEYLSQFGTAGSGNGQLSAPKEIAIDKAGSLWVVDTGNNRVQKWGY
jgi:DNA-binding beta-propeller fold protein YncE